MLLCRVVGRVHPTAGPRSSPAAGSTCSRPSTAGSPARAAATSPSTRSARRRASSCYGRAASAAPGRGPGRAAGRPRGRRRPRRPAGLPRRCRVILCRVLGSTVATRKDVKLEGTKLLVVAEADPDGAEREELHVAADAIGAGAGDLVLVTIGSAARLTRADPGPPSTRSWSASSIPRVDVGGSATPRRAVSPGARGGRVVASRRVEELGSTRLLLLQPLDEARAGRRPRAGRRRPAGARRCRATCLVRQRLGRRRCAAGAGAGGRRGRRPRRPHHGRGAVIAARVVANVAGSVSTRVRRTPAAGGAPVPPRRRARAEFLAVDAIGAGVGDDVLVSRPPG